MSDYSHIKKIGLSGGYDLLPTEKATKRALLKLLTDKINGSSNQTLELTRSEQRYECYTFDDNKFMYPLLPDLPVAAFTFINNLIPATKTVAIGSSEQGTIVQAVNNSIDQLKYEDLEKIIFIEEKSRGTKADNWMALGNAHELKSDEPILICCVDIPLKYNIYPQLMDPDIGAKILIDLNAKENMPEGTARGNFYDVIIQNNTNKKLTWKESNYYIFTGAGLHTTKNAINVLQKWRKGGQQYLGILHLGIQTLVQIGVNHGEAATKKFGHLLVKYIRSKFSSPGSGKPPLALTEDEASWAVSLFASNQKERTKSVIKARNKDPYALIDVDSLNTDYLFYRAVLEKIYFNGKNEGDLDNLRKYYPHVDLLKRTQQCISEKHIPFIEYFDNFLNMKIETYNKYLVNFEKCFPEDIMEVYKGGWRRNRKKLSKKQYETLWKDSLIEMEKGMPCAIKDGRVNFDFFGKNKNQMISRVETHIKYLRERYLPQYAHDKREFEKIAAT